jgi:hypothetical protein
MQIEQHQFRAGIRHDFDRANAVFRLADHLVPKVIRTDLVQDFAKHQMVFDYYNPHGERWEWFDGGKVNGAMRRALAANNTMGRQDITDSTSIPPAESPYPRMDAILRGDRDRPWP